MVKPVSPFKSLLFGCLITGLFHISAQNLDSTNLPIVMIQTGNNEIVDEPKVAGTLRIIDNGPGLMNHIDDPVNDYDGPIGIEFRGSSSQFFFPKKGYGLELWQPDGSDSSAVVLGLPKEEDWVLHGPYSDKSLMRNALAFELWSRTGRYGSRTRFVELMINGQYEGVYLFMEKVKRDNDRIDISKLTSDENSGDALTGGYIIKLDKFDGSNSRGGWESVYLPKGREREEPIIFFQYEYPKGDEITDHQKDYIQTYLSAFEDALLSPLFDDPVKGYRQLADVNSFIDFSIINELTRNVDGYRLSTFLHKDRDSDGGKLKMGPVWDFNLAFGNADYCKGGNTDGWAWDFNMVCPEDFWLMPFWWARFLQDPEYVAALKERWSALRRDAFATESVMTYVDSLAQELARPQQRNFERWPDAMGQYVWPNNFVGSSYDEEVTYLKNWISDRLDWLDQHINAMEVGEVTGVQSNQTEYSVHPNPFTNSIEVSRASPASISLRLYSLQGRLLRARRVDDRSAQLETSDLPPGPYLLSIEDADGSFRGRLVIKKY